MANSFRRVHLTCNILLFQFCILTTCCRAQVECDTTIVLPGITVTATRSQTTTAAAPMRVTVLDASPVEQYGVHTLPELLEDRTGAYIRQYGAGGLSTLSIRGTGSQQTLVLLDGHRIADPQLGQLDLSLFPAILLESVEVMYGAGSALYGSDGMGGVVNLRTLSPGDNSGFRLIGELGAYGEQNGGCLLKRAYGKYAVLGLIEYSRADGDFLYTNEALFPPRKVVRENADRKRLSLYSSISYSSGEHRLRLAGWYNDSERGLPGLATTPSKDERQWDKLARFWVDDELQFRWGLLQIGGLLQQSTLRYVNPQLELDDTGQTVISSLEVEAIIPAGSKWLVSGGLSGGYGRARHPSLVSRAQEYQSSVFVHATGQIGRWFFYPALRTDTYITDLGLRRFVFNPGLGINVKPFSDGPFNVKVSTGRSFRMPTFNDRFWQPGGNPDLNPERGWSYDAGLYIQRSRDVAELSVFGAQAMDQIVWLPSDDGYWVPDNVYRTRTLGAELSYRRIWSWRHRYHLEGGLFYTFTDARNRSDPTSSSYSHQLRYVPREQLKLYLGVNAGRLGLDVNGRYTGRRFITEDGSQYLDPHVVLDAQVRVSQQIGGITTQVSLNVENLFDARYAVVQHYPMPPRHLRLKVLIEFDSNRY